MCIGRENLSMASLTTLTMPAWEHLRGIKGEYDETLVRRELLTLRR